ncbi:hypothetical protein [Polynucleobacter sp. UB-Piko-W3]|jgi:hypothetical protein|uniref:hypothetical protein n=1 Tax=Polynucleobacter sp. UB-Piko-W3 TaxID=1819735 RepID=UPI001C0E1563|nr:hypothetical protein [Polynucleobacter sp. UB-Piko-W3]MBU3555015.1 hypothetical protein [Polynucleobacter sp. UB-Piko-W3]
MALFNLGSTTPQYMDQSLFDAAIFRFYCLRHQYEDFQSFWHAKKVDSSGAEIRLVDSLFAQAAKYTKDEHLRGQLSQACLEIEKYWNMKFGSSSESLSVFSSIKSQAEEALLKSEAQAQELNAKSSQSPVNPDSRVDSCMRNLYRYEMQIAQLNPVSFDVQTKMHFFLNGLNESLSSSFKYSGSVLKVLDQDSYIQNEDTTWGRWTLFRDSTGYSDIWIVRIENGRAEVVKAVSKLNQDTYELDESIRGIHFDSEIFKAIDKTQISAFENSEFNLSPPSYFQMLSMLNVTGVEVFEKR